MCGEGAAPFSTVESVDGVDGVGDESNDYEQEGLKRVDGNLSQLRAKLDGKGSLTAVVMLNAAEYGLQQTTHSIHITVIPLDPRGCDPRPHMA